MWCRSCDEVLNAAAIERWVKAAERVRDEAYLLVEGECDLEARQKEVYRRRKVLYELREKPRVAARPEMLLVVYSQTKNRYECQVFYKEPRPAGCAERFVLEASLDSIWEARSSGDSILRIVGQKVHKFHEARMGSASRSEAAPSRRVFYANELS